MSNYEDPNMASSSRKAPLTEYYSSGSEYKIKKSTSGSNKRPSRAGTRSVTTLTPEQLERKRANDREAQRAIRERTKDHIEGLERRVAVLERGNPELAAATQRIEKLEQENADLRSRLALAEGRGISRTGERMPIHSQPLPPSYTSGPQSSATGTLPTTSLASYGPYQGMPAPSANTYSVGTRGFPPTGYGSNYNVSGQPLHYQYGGQAASYHPAPQSQEVRWGHQSYLGTVFNPYSSQYSTK